MTLPDTMRAAIAHRLDGSPDAVTVDTVEVPTPGPGEVLVRMRAAPLNPNDLLFLTDRYMIRREAPTVVGFEGVGDVVACGGGALSWALQGRRVSLTASEHSGTWAEYAIAPALRCLPLLPRLSDAQGATMLTNPFSAWAMVDHARAQHRAMVQTAASGALGSAIARLCLELGFPCLHVVRREAQVQALRELGAEHVLDSSTPDFDERFAALSAELGATLCLDAVAGDTGSRILHLMPPGSTLRIIGTLSGADLSIEADDMLFHGKRVEGFTMHEWAEQAGLAEQGRVALQVQRHLGGALAVPIREEQPLDEVANALARYRAAMGAGKILLRMHA